jgi:O-antigen/teichoic acid export membrane protein
MFRARLEIVLGWFREKDFRKLWKNAATLVAGNLSAAVLDLVTLVLTARLLGVESFGVLVLIQTCVRIADAATNFQSWQAIIKFGADAMAMPDTSNFAKLIKFGTFLDAASSSLGALVSVGVFMIVARWQMWGADTTTLAMAYGLSIVFNIIGTPQAILRLFGKFRTLAAAQFGVALIKMIAIVVAFLNPWDFASIVWIWILANIATPLLIVALGWRVVHIRLGIVNVMRTPLHGVRRQFKGIVRFFITTNLTESVRLVAKEFDIVVVTYFTGTGGAGIYKIAKQFAAIPERFTLPVRDAVYPEIAKLHAAGDITLMKSYMTRIGLLCGGFGLFVLAGALVLGRLAIDLTAGPEYASAYWPLIVYLASLIIYMFGISFQAVLLSANKPIRILQVFLVGNVIYFVAIVPLCSLYGVIGAATAHVVYYLVWFAGMKLSIDKFLPKNTVP